MRTPQEAAERLSLDWDGIPGWYNQRDSAELDRLGRIARDVEGCVVEFGSYQGRSAAILAATTERRVVCVDPWPDPEDLDAFHRHTRGLDVESHRWGWREWLTQVEPYGVRFALCHIDADHRYEQVASSIEAMLPLIEPGGVLCGHDYGWPSGDHDGVTRAVDELLPHRHVGGSVWSVRG